MANSKVPKLTHSSRSKGPAPSRVKVKSVTVTHDKAAAQQKASAVNIPEVACKSSILPPSIEAMSHSRPHQAVSYDWTAAQQQIQQKRLFDITVPESEYPHIIVTIPDNWPYIKIVPLYDVHIGSAEMDGEKFARDILWLANEPYTVTFNGGDLWDNAIKASIASSFSDDKNPNEQYSVAEDSLRLLLPKIMFGLPGNHEDRTGRFADVDVAKILHNNLGIPYSPDYMMCTIKWRENRIRILAHHGTGAAASAGGQRNAARKDMTWAHSFDLYWTGHLHQALVDQIEIVYFNQESDTPTNKTVYSIISPSYLKYFGGYAAKKRLAPGARGVTSVVIQPDGRIDTETHANGKRL